MGATPHRDEPPALTVKRSGTAMLVALLAGACGTLILPYLFPVKASISTSYLVGFNNRVSLVAFVAFLALFAWWTDGFGLLAPDSEAGDTPEVPSRILLYAVIAAFVLFTSAEWLLQRSHPAMGEATYFLDRLQHLQNGQVPYLQFDFPYGPLILYLPLWASWLFRVSIADSYYICWILENIVGVALIYQCARLLPATQTQKNNIFFAMACTWWAGPLTFGHNYTPFRFFLGPFLCLLAARRITSQTAPLRFAFEALLAETLLLLVSPEQAIAFCGAIVLFLLISVVQTRVFSLFIPLGVFAAGSVTLLALCSGLGLFLTLQTMSHGGYNFPLLPVMQHIPVVALLIVSASALINAVRRRRSLGAIELLVLFSLFTLPAGFGRADIGHFMINSTAAILAAWFVLAQYPSLFRAFVWAYFLLVILFPAPSTLMTAARAQRANRGRQLVRSGGSPNQELIGAPEDAMKQVSQHAVLFAPMGRPLGNSPSVPSVYADTGFYNGLELVTLPFQIDQKILELQRSPKRDLILPVGFTCDYTYDRQSYGQTLLTPYVPRARRTSDILQPMCRYIHLHYRQSAIPSDLNGFAIWNPIVPQPDF